MDHGDDIHSIRREKTILLAFLRCITGQLAVKSEVLLSVTSNDAHSEPEADKAASTSAYCTHSYMIANSKANTDVRPIRDRDPYDGMSPVKSLAMEHKTIRSHWP
ncbi:hypothetical protein SNOG_03961 [Parastagonospora nodorum SN15]|uniref:Uncharacterized protein n=1 Tax=Phaeosphaeria nodorum (strain SN15 / ATCC MYA-4574 / FGSC 10173) TaxID=321614 RepID=Q0UWA3_PHANO|nr:hypothetical protein SNOG_03961 [Parastagonospora nodorum SN15]EAT89166.1 hypothetical protein SNOG_03961 [Parastagonospora nodorum SN15]